jgi:nitroimidazol reductase NimA-like FMN-containing flavoprotein (pyridoxamine 5'-phosphate oxidase superfamily)/GNAT superfamily N-acetyltransferase
MRREIFRMPAAEAVRLFRTAPFVHLATTDARGEPLLRVVNGVVVDGALHFHGARSGEKLEALGRSVVASVDEVVASIPSTFVHPELACPATTLYRSAQAHGTLEEETDHATKVRVLAALLEKLQPEGGYVPLEAAPERYGPVVRSLLVARLALDRVDGKAKLGQNRSSAEVTRMLEGMWRRGAPGDPRAIELVRSACRDAAPPSFLEARGAPAALSLHVHASDDDAAEAAALVEDAYWNRGIPRECIARAHRASSAWVLARERSSGRIVATARAISDGAKRAWIYDVFVAVEHRGQGLGTRIMKLLLDHPRVRHVARVHLSTRDAQLFYRGLGFCDAHEALAPRTELVRTRPDA